MSYRIHGKYLRNLPVLPDNISSTVEEFRVEAWQRLDERICLDDITARMHPDFRIKNNALQQRGVRFRQAFNIIAWRSGNKRSAQLEADLMQKMSSLGLDVKFNSTRGITPGLIDPSRGESGGRVPIPACWQQRKLGSEGPMLTQQAATTEPVTMELEIRPKKINDPPKVSEDVEMSDDVSEHVAGIIQLIQEFTEYDPSHDHPESALPVIRGLVPDEQLPGTVRMKDINLLEGYGQPTPQIIDNEELPLLTNPDRIEYRSKQGWTPNSAISNSEFCDSFCHEPAPVQYEEFIDFPIEAFDTPSKPQTPTTDLFPFTTPMKLDLLPEGVQKIVFDDMLAEYYKGERYVPEMPWISV